MSTEPQKNLPRKSRVWATINALIRARVTAGLLVVLPIYITYLLVKFVFGVMRDASGWVVEAVLQSERFRITATTWGAPWTDYGAGSITLDQLLSAKPAFGWSIAIASVLLTIFILYVVGLLTANIVGKRVVDLFELMLDKLPLVKTVYRASKQVLETFTGDQSKSFQRVALVPFPDSSMRAVGFVTGVFQDFVTGEELVTVFIPTTPNPTTGYLQVMRRSDITEMDWSVEDAVRVIMSGGILRAPKITMVTNRDRAVVAPRQS